MDSRLLGRILGNIDGIGQVRVPRIEILKEFLEQIPNGRIAGLWLSDEDSTSDAITLWAVAEPHEEVTHPAFWGHSICIERHQHFHAAMWEAASAGHQETLARSMVTSMRLAATSINVHSHEIGSSVVLPIFSLSPASKLTGPNPKSDKPAIIGYVTLLFNGSTYVPDKACGERLAICAALFGTRIHVGRRQRSVDAMHDLQMLLRHQTDIGDIFSNTVDLVRRHTNADEVSIFETGANQKVVRVASATRDLAGSDASGISLEPIAAHQKSATSRSHFLRPWHDEPSIMRIRNIAASNQRFSQFAADTIWTEETNLPRTEPAIAWATIRTVCEGVLPNRRVPLITLRLIAQPRRDFIGGIFSSADIEIATAISEYLADLLPGLKVRERAEKLSKSFLLSRAAKRPTSEDNELDDTDRLFSRLIVDLVPQISQCWVVRRSQGPAEPNTETRYISDKSGDPPQHVALDWRGHSIRHMASPRTEEHYWWLCAVEGSNYLGLLARSSSDILTGDQHHLMKMVLSDLLLKWYGQIDVSERIRRVKEIRHALRGALNSIEGHSATAIEYFHHAEAMPPDEAHKEIFTKAGFRKSLERIRFSSLELKTFFEDVRVVFADLAKDDLQLTRYKLSAILNDLRQSAMVELLSRAQTLTINDNYPRSIPDPIVDSRLLKVAFFNLIDNAMKYSRKGRQITIDIRVIGSNWNVSVTNIGRYIPSDEREKLKKPLYRGTVATGEQKMPGTGLGLAGVERIIKAHSQNARLIIKSDLLSEKGRSARTTFTVEMPRELGE